MRDSILLLLDVRLQVIHLIAFALYLCIFLLTSTLERDDLVDELLICGSSFLNGLGLLFLSSRKIKGKNKHLELECTHRIMKETS